MSGFQFINYDDPDYVTSNPVVQRGLSVDGLEWAFGRIHGENTYWHPLAWMSHMIDCELFGVNPGAHHLVNVMFHIGNAILAFLCLYYGTGAFWRSAVVAALFAIHPLQVGTVAWVTERKNLLSALFWFLATLSYLKYVRSRAVFAYIGSLLLFALGLMSKPAIVVFPCALLLLDYWPLGRFPASKWKLLVEKIPFFALSLVSSVVTVMAHEKLGMTQASHGLPLVYRMENGIVSYALYLKKVIWPSDLSILYPHPGVWPRSTVYGAALILLLITLFVAWKRKPYAITGWLWFLGVLVPALGILQVGYQAMGDRFVYISIIGLFIAIVWSAAEILSNSRNAVAAAVLSCVSVIYFLAWTGWQLGHWKDSEAIFTRALQLNDRNYVAHYDLALALIDKDRPAEAQPHAERATHLDRRSVEAVGVLGLTLEMQTNLVGAITNYRRAVEMDPHSSGWRRHLGLALLRSGQLAAAREELLRVPAPGLDVHASLGDIYVAEKNAALARQHYENALKLAPRSAPVLNNLAWLLATHPDSALRDGAEAVRLAELACQETGFNKPVYIGTLAAAYAEAGRFDDAITTAKRARDLALQQDQPDLAARNGELLSLYEQKRAFHETN